MTKRAAIYARVSTERQREKHTIASQLSLLPELIQQRGYIQVRDPYIDDGISGETIDGRPAMMKLLEDTERGLFDAVFVVDLDRLTRARKSIDWEIIKDAFRKGGVQIVTPGTEYDFNDEDQEFMSDIFSRIAAYEKKKIIRRMIRGKQEKARTGKFFGGKPPYGYAVGRNTAEFEIKDDEAHVIRLLFGLCLRGYSIKQCCKYLNDMGIPAPLANKWGTTTVRRLLRDSLYAGKYQRWRYKSDGRGGWGVREQGEWLTVNIPPIIDSEIFAAAQNALNGRRILSKRNAKTPYLLSGLIYCQSCHCKMTGEANERARYYVCHNGRRRILETPCPLPWLRADDIERDVWSEIASLLNNPDLLKRAILDHGKNDTPKKTVSDLEALLHHKEGEEDRLLDLYQYGRLDKKKLTIRLEALAAQKENLRGDIESAKGKSKVDYRLLPLSQLKTGLTAKIETLGFESKREILKTLLFGDAGAGIFVKRDFSIEIRGVVDFGKLGRSGITDCIPARRDPKSIAYPFMAKLQYS